MWNFLKSVHLIRYLIVLRVNRTLVRMPRYLPTEISLVLGTLIADRLPTREAAEWRKSLSAWDEYGGISVIGQRKPARPVPEVAWPIEAVIRPIPGKLNYGMGELIFWELKLMGNQADHAIFLEVILPALEEAGYNTAAPWSGRTTLWGRFDIHAVFAARGKQWIPIVQEGRLNLHRRITPQQWATRLRFFPRRSETFQQLTWLTPFDFSDSQRFPRTQVPPSAEIPSPREILDALIERLAVLRPERRHTPEDFWNALDPNEQTELMNVLDQSEQISMRRFELTRPPKEWPSRWIGTQVFDEIPYAVIPYLELASILHVGRNTHLGCGTFTLS